MRGAKKVNNFSDSFKLKSPAIIQAPMAGGITTPELVAAVSNKNGLGSFATGYLKTEQVKIGIQEIKKLTNNPFSVNVFIPNETKKNLEQIKIYQRALNKFRSELGMKEEEEVPDALFQKDNFDEIIEVLLQEKIEIVSFTFGNLPSDIIRAFKKNGTYLIGTATSLEEAKILSDSDIDAIVVQGHESGGHRGGFFTPYKRGSMGTMALIPQIVNCIDKPIIASGGIMDGRGIVASLALGASAVQMGTAFLATHESGADPTYKETLIKAKDFHSDITTVTNVYSGKMVRAIRTDFIDDMEANLPSVPDYPIPHLLSSPVRKEAAKKKATHIMSMWSGQGVSLIRNNLSAGDLVEKLHAEVKECLEDLSVCQPTFKK